MNRGRRGHWCWACDRYLPNERFSGRNHGRHFCRGCAKLPRAELELRQAERDLERPVDWNGLIRRRRHKEFARFLEHPNPRVREPAGRIQEADAEAGRSSAAC
jgi:hypothetical protein